jgi:hypothetical protein
MNRTLLKAGIVTATLATGGAVAGIAGAAAAPSSTTGTTGSGGTSTTQTTPTTPSTTTPPGTGAPRYGPSGHHCPHMGSNASPGGSPGTGSPGTGFQGGPPPSVTNA